MNRVLLAVTLVAFVAATGAAVAEPSLTIYNQDFAVVRETIPLVLRDGETVTDYTDITRQLEPDSVILRDPAGKRTIQVLEQNYRADPVSQELLLSLNEGETIDFLVQRGDIEDRVTGTIVRSGYVRPIRNAHGHVMTSHSQPIIEVDGKLRFGLPGVPLFPALRGDTVLKPTLHWVLRSNKAGPVDAELCYVTGGFTWDASYNLVAPPKGDSLDVVGWITMQNRTGKVFRNAQVKLMAGDVSKLQPQTRQAGYSAEMAFYSGVPSEPNVREKVFDEYHLYTVQRPTTLHANETKQVEFLRAARVKMTRFYVYNGAKIDANRYRNWDSQRIRQDENYGTQSNPKVWTMCEFENTDKNGLGVPLPQGRTRFYRRDDDNQLEFTGENIIRHTPRGETVRVYVGNAFDLVGERRRTNHSVEHSRRTLDEAFEIKLRNRKKEPVEIRVVENLYRWRKWEVTQSSDPFKKTESQSIEFRVEVKPDEERTVTYKVHYTW
ncbi:MAG: hypothetical protein GY851_21935 [bacterium]|nr:hypothetical protein [bacterium]